MATETGPREREARRALLLLIGELATVRFMEGRASADPSDPMYGQYREAVEIVMEEERRRAGKEVRRLLRSGAVSKYELLRAGVR